MDVSTVSRCGLLVFFILATEAMATIDPRGATRLHYDANGNVVQRVTPLRDSGYGYDALNRLTRETADGISTQRDYDANGNRLTDSGAVERHYRYEPASNRLSGIDHGDIEHDAAGHRITDRDGTRRFEYNAAGRLTHIYEYEVLVASYTYNALGQRSRKQTPDGVTVFHYDLAGHLIAETSESGQPIRDIVWMDDTPVAQITDTAGTERIVYLHTDQLNTPRMATDRAQQTVWRWESDAFGSTPAEEDPDGDGTSTQMNLRFPGQYYDAESGLHYNYFRYYEAETGRYVTSDPIGLEGGLNMYGYVSGNPLYWVDPRGLDGYLVSRPLSFTELASHNFPVTNADYIGDPNATVYSYGRNSLGNTGRVDENTIGWSSTTSRADRAFWESLSEGYCAVENSNVSLIPAPDATIDRCANSLLANTDYAALGWIFGTNSNSAASAVANRCSGTIVPIPGPPNRLSPGASNWNQIQFAE